MADDITGGDLDRRRPGGRRRTRSADQNANQAQRGDRESRPLEEGSSRAPHARSTLRRPGGEASEEARLRHSRPDTCTGDKSTEDRGAPETRTPNPAPRTGSPLRRAGPWFNSDPRPAPGTDGMSDKRSEPIAALICRRAPRRVTPEMSPAAGGRQLPSFIRAPVATVATQCPAAAWPGTMLQSGKAGASSRRLLCHHRLTGS